MDNWDEEAEGKERRRKTGDRRRDPALRPFDDAQNRQGHFDGFDKLTAGRLSANRTGTQGINWRGFSISIGGCPYFVYFVPIFILYS